MANKFFILLDWTIYTRILYSRYYTRVLWIERAVYIVSALLTCSGVIAFIDGGHTPRALSMLAVVFAQALTIAYPHLPYTKRRFAVEAMLPRYWAVERKIAAVWRNCPEDTEAAQDEYAARLAEFEDIDTELLGGEIIRFPRRMEQQADAEKRQEMFVKYGVNPHDYLDTETGQHIKPAGQG